MLFTFILFTRFCYQLSSDWEKMIKLSIIVVTEPSAVTNFTASLTLFVHSLASFN